LTLDRFPGPVTVIVAHPDDIEAHCAGTVARLVQGGRAVNYVLATSGNRGTADPAMTADALASLREQEQIAAAQLIGVTNIQFLRYDDGDLMFLFRELRRDLNRVIRRYRPTTIITHDPFPGNGSHDSCSIYPDHLILGRTVFETAYLRSPSPLCEPELISEERLQPHKPSVIMLIMSGSPNVFVDIGDVFDLRMHALRDHKSQGRDNPDLYEFFELIARDLGRRSGYDLAEAFRTLPPT
jgi:LmbE family N-acetylglucosaminyl deacetylase